jgi:DNA-directed RNA polymerase subunit RPC12/RpoP
MTCFNCKKEIPETDAVEFYENKRIGEIIECPFCLSKNEVDLDYVYNGSDELPVVTLVKP